MPMILKNFFKRNSEKILVLIFSLLSYFILSSQLDVYISTDLMFDGFKPGADSHSYLLTGEWIFESKPTEYIAYRPFLFPVIIYCLNSLGGIWLIWIFHVTLYLFSGLLIYLAVVRATQRKWFGVIALTLFLLNFSLVGLTYHALTETSVIFGMAVFVYIVSGFCTKTMALSPFLMKTLIILGILSLVKPVFTIPFYVLLVLIVILLIAKKIKFPSWLKIPFILVLSGFVIQFSIVSFNCNKVSFSLIGEKTYREYFMVQVLMETDGLKRDEALVAIRQMEKDEIKSLAVNNFKIAVNIFFDNVIENIQSRSYIENFINPQINKSPAKFMKWYNWLNLYFYLFIFVIGFFFVLNYLRSKDSDRFVSLSALLFLALYMLLVTGIAFDQRDRLIITTLPLWIFLILFLVNLLTLKKVKPMNQAH